MNDQWLDGHIAAQHYGWKIVQRDGLPVLVNPDGKFEVPPGFSALAEESRAMQKAERKWGERDIAF